MDHYLLKSLYELSLHSETKEVLKIFNHLLEEVKLGMLTIAFSGFDAVGMRHTLKEHKIQDLEAIITIGLVCGDNIPLIKTIINDKYKPILQLWENSYKLVSEDAGDPDAVTLSRVIACFPEIAALVLHKNKHPLVVNKLSLQTIAAGFPMAARHKAVAAIIPETLKNNDMRDCLSVFIVPSLLILERLNVDNDFWLSRSKTRRVTTSLAFVLNSYHTKVVSARKRVKIAKVIGMVVSGPDGLVLSDVWRSAAKKCAQWLYAKYNYKLDEEITLE